MHRDIINGGQQLYRYQFTSTVEDLLDTEEADMIEKTGMRRSLRWFVSFFGLFMVVCGLIGFARTLGWKYLLVVLSGSILLYSYFIESFVTRRRIRETNDSSQELTLEFNDDYLLTEAIGKGTSKRNKREWSELADIKTAKRGVLLYFYDGDLNWLPNRVFMGTAEKAAFAQYIKSRVDQVAQENFG